jgi:hypothetical protein
MTLPISNTFAIYAEAEGHSELLIMTGVPFGRLMDDIVVPYQTEKPFFVDGAPVTRKDLRKLKILRLSANFAGAFAQMHSILHHSGHSFQKLYGEQYQIRVEALLREHGEDVTSQVNSAYDKTIKHHLKDYLPKREEMIKTALQVFIESVKLLNGT